MARSSITVKQILADARMLAGATDYTNPTDTSMIVKYNLVVNKIYKLLNGAKFAKFRSHSPVGTPAGYIFQNTAQNRTYTASTKKITISSLSSTALGSLVMWYDSSGDDAFCSYITAVTVNTDFTVASGGSINIAAGNLTYIILSPPSGSSHDVDDYRMDSLVRVQFPLAGNAPRVNEDVREQASAQYATSSLVTLSGVSGSQTIEVKVGSETVNNGGFPVAFFDEKPRVATTVSDFADLPTEYHAMLAEEIARITTLELGTQTPKALESPLLTAGVVSGAFVSSMEAIQRDKDKQ